MALFHNATSFVHAMRCGAQQNSLIALFVMMPVFYVAGNEFILSVRCFTSYNPVR